MLSFKRIKYNIIDKIIEFYGLRFFIDEFEMEESVIHDFVTSTYQNFPVEEDFKMGNYTLVIDLQPMNFWPSWFDRSILAFGLYFILG